MWIIIPILALSIPLLGMYYSHQRKKLELMDNQQHAEEVEDLRKLIHSLKGRIENLEAIAAGNPDDFLREDESRISNIEIEEEPPSKTEHQQQVSDIADQKRTH